MKSPAPSDPRLSCRFVRWWATLVGDAAPSVTRHVQTCACCREHFAAARAFDDRLRSAAGRAPVVPPGFETRLARAVQHSIRAKPAEEPKSSMVFWSFLGSVGVGAAIIALIFLNAPPPVSPEGPIQIVEQSDGPAPTSATPERPPVASLPSGEAIVRTISQDPLQEEIELVYADARAALQFLARNFLPGENAPRESTDSGTTS